jgi:hypothetical protein
VGQSVADFAGQLRDLAGQAGSSLEPLPSLGLPSPPGALSAAQIQAIAKGISAQRTQIAAVTEQLEALDSQLAVLQSLLEPLVEWTSTWADLEKAVGGLLPTRPEDHTIHP